MLRITDFCSCIYVFGCKLSLVTLCDSDFGITPVDDITIGITSIQSRSNHVMHCYVSYRYVFVARDVRIRGYFSKPKGDREQKALGDIDLA